MNIWQSYKQERGCLMHFARLANTLLKDAENARDNHVLAFNFARYSPILSFVSLADSAIKVKGKVVPYSLPSAGPGADPGVQAVSPQVT